MPTSEPKPWVEFWVVRTAQKRSMISVADATGYSRQWLYALERGHRQPTEPAIQRIAAALSVPDSWLRPGRADNSDESVARELVTRLSTALNIPEQVLYGLVATRQSDPADQPDPADTPKKAGAA